MSDDFISKKPPIGIEPRYSRDSRRVQEILSAMERYAADGFGIPSAWIAELKELIDTYMSGKLSEELPSAQPIIHCGTCKWFQCNMRPDGYLPKGVEEFECRHWCGPCDPDDFCSHAERRTDGVDS